MAGAIAVAGGCAVLVPDYRLAPEHPFPAAVDDAARALEWLLDSGTSLDEVVVAGDSSGAGLVVSLLLSLRREQRPQPGAAALLCPVLDLTFDKLAAAGPGAEPALDVDQLRLFASWYGGGDLTDEVLAPLDADLSGLPALLVHTADGDTFSVDARRFAERATQAGVDVTFEQYPVATHDFHVFWSMLPAAAQAVDDVGAFVRACRIAG
jgi:acetyl esterase/lipase